MQKLKRKDLKIDVLTTKCPKCNGKLSVGEVFQESDGTQATELICDNCKQRFADVKLPYSALIKEIIDDNN